MVDMNVAVFKSNFDGGSRSNRFAVTGNLGGAAGGPINNIVVKAASMPAVTVGILRVPFRGRVVKIPGDRTYEEWTFTVMDGFDGKSNFRDGFIDWNAEFNLHEDNVPGGNFSNGAGGVQLDAAGLFTTFNVHQLGMNGSVIRSVNLFKCWPTLVSEISLSYDNADTISEYTVTLAYDYLEHFGTGQGGSSPQSAGGVDTAHRGGGAAQVSPATAPQFNPFNFLFPWSNR